MSLAAKLRRARAMADRLPSPPLTSRFWLTAFERCGAGELRLAEREPDWGRLLAAYRKVFAVPGPESEALHEWLSELFLRAHRGVPPCGEAEFAELAAWFRASEHARRLGVHAWSTAALPGGAAVSLRGLREGIDRGPGRFGSGRVAERLRELRRAGGPRNCPEPARAAAGDRGRSRRRGRVTTPAERGGPEGAGASTAAGGGNATGCSGRSGC